MYQRQHYSSDHKARLDLTVLTLTVTVMLGQCCASEKHCTLVIGTNICVIIAPVCLSSFSK